MVVFTLQTDANRLVGSDARVDIEKGMIRRRDIHISVVNSEPAVPVPAAYLRESSIQGEYL